MDSEEVVGSIVSGLIQTLKPGARIMRYELADYESMIRLQAPLEL